MVKMMQRIIMEVGQHEHGDDDMIGDTMVRG
jgi:hypothetical protein